MHLIFGGAYQGKLDYAKERYQLTDRDVFTCVPEENKPGFVTLPELDFSRRAINQLEEFVMNCIRSDVEAKDYLEANRGKWSDMILICTDISSGIVPYEKELRAWREMVGRTLVYLGKEAEEITRMFCGIPQKIK